MSDPLPQPAPPGLKAALEAYLLENQAAFLAHALSPAMPESMSGIHQMRVAAKRLRSLFRLMEWLAPEQFQARAELSHVRAFFKAAGKVRDIQVRQALLDRYCDQLGLDFPRYADMLRKRRVKAQKKLRKAMPAFHKGMLIHAAQHMLHLLSEMEEDEVMRSACHLVEQRWEDIALLFPPHHDAERLHGVRILLKESYYVMTQVQAAALEPAWPEALMERVKKAAETAGDWHDLEVLHAALVEEAKIQPALFPQPHPFEILLGAVDEQLQHALRRYRRQLKKLLKELRPASSAN